MALARRYAAARQALGFLYIDGHARAYHGTRTVQKMHIARLKFPAPATEETWVTSEDGEPGTVAAELSESLAGELRRRSELRQVVGDGRRVTVCFDRGGGPRPCSPTSPRPGSTCSPGARARPPTCPPPRSPPSPALMTGAASTNTTWPIPRSR